MRDVDGFGERYRAARLLLMDYWADQIVDIADDGDLDPRDRQIRTGVRQWIMSKVSRGYESASCTAEIRNRRCGWCTNSCCLLI